jgi:hypothetical protein
MVINVSRKTALQSGALMAELLVAIALLTSALLPVAYAIRSEKDLARGYYQRAVAMEIVDGEMEFLLAGGWREFPPGTHEYPIRANAAVNLSDGKFLVTVSSNLIRMEWQPEKQHGGPVVREVTFK